MDWIESIKEIQNASANSKLVIFVGSGVSANSNIPTWGELVRQFAKKLDIDHCNDCILRSNDCPTSDCHCRYNFNQEDYLRIPEYFFLRYGQEEYYRFIREALQCDSDANAVVDIIFKTMPHHIITTNYDHLLENSEEVNAQMYDVIVQDKDLLSKNSPHYIIKMHGDIEQMDSIVLKESDYIEYEQTHILISTFIKALLVDHTFLFVGYSLNDYNLNLIIGWINYFVDAYGVNNRPRNYIIQTEAPTEYEELRLSGKNIFVISTDKIPNDILFKASPLPEISDMRGRMVYAYLKCIYNSEVYTQYIPLLDILYEKYEVLKSYNKISYEDLKSVFPLEQTQWKGQTLCFWNESLYRKMTSILSGSSDKKDFIMTILQKTGIRELYCIRPEKRFPIPILKSDEDEIFQLYLNNRYLDVINKLSIGDDPSTQAYYYNLFMINISELDALMEAVKHNISRGDYISTILYKLNCRSLKIIDFERYSLDTKEIEHLLVTAPPKYRAALGYLSKLFHSMSGNIKKMEDLLQKHRERYSYNNSTFYSGHSFDNLWDIQAYAYDYYFFMNENHLMMYHYSDPKTYLSYYLKSILCTYGPTDYNEYKSIWGINKRLEQYTINEIDLDMFVKYTDPKDLQSWVSEYKVNSLMLEEGLYITPKFIHFCESFAFFGARWSDQLLNFSVILSKLNIETQELLDISIAFVKMVEEVLSSSFTSIITLLPTINLFVSDMMNNSPRELKQRLLTTMTKTYIVDEAIKKNKNTYKQILSKLAPFVSIENRNRIDHDIESLDDDVLRSQRIFYFRELFPKKKYKAYFIKHIEALSSECLFILVRDGYLALSKRIKARFLSIIEDVISERKATNTRKFPDWAVTTIEYYIILKLLGKHMDLFELEQYKDLSIHLAFMLSPEEFDYSKIDMNHYMWGNLIRHAEYSEYFYKHRKEILNRDLENVFLNGFSSVAQQKIVYGFLLEKDQIWEYANPN